MNAIILCAGYATRLYPLTQDKPKSLLPVSGQPILNYLIGKVQKIKALKTIYIVSNAKFYGQFLEWKTKFYPTDAIHVLNDGTTSNENRLGAIRDILFVIQEKKVADDILVLAGDNLFDAEIVDFACAAETHRPNGTLGVYDVKDLTLATRYGLVSHDEHSKITAFFEKPPQPKTTLASMGLYFFPKESIAWMERYIKENQNPDAPGHYIEWLVRESQIFAFPFSGTWYDIGDFESYRKADQAFSH